MKIVRFLFTVVHLLIIFGLILTLFNQFISPEQLALLNLFALSFPVLMLANLVFCILWLLFKKKRVLFFLIFSLFFAKPTLRWLNYTQNSVSKEDIKILTYNMHSGTPELGLRLAPYLNNCGADIIFGQELGLAEFVQPKLNYPYAINTYRLIGIYSKYKIVKEGEIFFDNFNSNAMFADVRIKNKTVRLINVYLKPFSMTKEMVEPERNFQKNIKKTGILVRTMLSIFKEHQKEVGAVISYIKNSPYPVILSGDFNSVPNSYEYYQIAKLLNDAFLQSGKGSATSFHDYKFPLRIDYIFSSSQIKATSYKVDRNVHLSDHFPVFGTFSIK